MGSTVQSIKEEKWIREYKHAGWNGWRIMSGLICDRRVYHAARVKGEVYKGCHSVWPHSDKPRSL